MLRARRVVSGRCLQLLFSLVLAYVLYGMLSESWVYPNQVVLCCHGDPFVFQLVGCVWNLQPCPALTSPRKPQVKTDDSFTFARAIKRLRQAIEALGDATGGGKATDGTAGDADEADEGESGSAEAVERSGISLSLERKRAIVLIMKEAFKSYHLAWARSSIEPAFKVRAKVMFIIYYLRY